MGSCCSTTGKLDRHSSMARSEDHLPSLESRAPPPTMDEETVKEVVLSVSEIPKLRPKMAKHEPEEEKTSVTGSIPVFPIFKLAGEEKRTRSMADEISEVSEIESVSTTTNVTNNDDEELGHVRIHRSPMKLPKNRSFSGDMGGAGRRERFNAGKSPSRRSEQSPGRKTNGLGSVRIVQSRDPGQVPARRGLNPSPADRTRRDPGEASGRRSRSPAMNRVDSGGVRRSPSARRAARSPGRANGAPNENTYRCDDRKSVKSNDGNDESLDNPLVSLECFIFL